MFFFFNDTATTEIYTLSLPDALPIFDSTPVACCTPVAAPGVSAEQAGTLASVFKALCDPNRVRIVNLLANSARSEEHTSELQSRLHLVCRPLLEKKKHVQDVRTSI